MLAPKGLKVLLSAMITGLLCLALAALAGAGEAAKSFTYYLSPTFTVVTEVSGAKANLAKVEILCDNKIAGKWELKADAPKAEIKQELACGFQKIKAGAVLQMQAPTAAQGGSVLLNGKLQMGGGAPMPLKIKVAKWPLK
jgi:hypothetical protein